MQLQLNIVTQLNWLDFRFEALLSSYSMMCSPWRLSSAIQSLVKSKLLTTNYLSPWKLHLYNEIDGDLSDISRTQTSEQMLYNIGLGVADDIDDMLVWHMPKLCMYHCITMSSVYIAYSHCSAWVHNLSFGLSCIDCYCYLYSCELVVSVVITTWSSNVHEAPAITTEVSARYAFDWHCVVVHCVKIKDRINFIFMSLVLYCFLDDAIQCNAVFTS